ncbi:MAG: hypothetical protein AAFX40_04895 [Cyanobacteria bacterium J06639_1]
MKSLQSSTLVALLAIAICGGMQFLSAIAYRQTYPSLGDRDTGDIQAIERESDIESASLVQ